MKINKLSPQDNIYTQVLTSIALVPKTLYYYGKLPEIRCPSVAIVGTRKPTRYGTEVTQRIAYELAQQGIVVISGMALGVDALAHRAALDAGGTTIAVQANGLDTLYPRTNQRLGEDIIQQGGAIISEYEPSVGARDFQFLERNRIVSGLADAIIITEAAARSGTLNTARHALEQGKDIFVVPGNITSPLSAGCNALLRQGALPLIEPKDVIERIAPQLVRQQTSLPLGDTPLQTEILKLLQAGLRDGDEMLKTLGVPASDFATELTMLEINGLVRPLGGNQWALR